MGQSFQKLTFKMRTGKKIEFGFNVLWLLLMAAFGVFVLKPMNGENVLSAALVMILFVGFPLAVVVIFLSGIFFARLEISEDGLNYQGLRPFHASWDEVIGFITINRELYLWTERLDGDKRVKRYLPITWFTKIQPDNKRYRSEVLDALKIFVPRLFDVQEEVSQTSHLPPVGQQQR